MIKECSYIHLNQCVDIALIRNTIPESNSAYCPTTEKAIRSDFENLIEDPNSLILGYFSEDILLAIFGFYFNNDSNNWVDCLGPFFLNEWDERIAIDMFSYATTKLPISSRFNFFFNTKNTNLHNLMSNINAKRSDNEYILNLYRDGFIKKENDHIVVKYSEKYKNDIIELHDEVHKNMYITGNDIISSIGIDREVFCALSDDNRFVGYGVLKRYKDKKRHITAEVFTVKEEYRGMGYGRAVLNAVILNAFYRYNANTVDLVVDKLNLNARELYFSCGFKLETENASYYLQKSN